ADGGQETPKKGYHHLDQPDPSVPCIHYVRRVGRHRIKDGSSGKLRAQAGGFHVPGSGGVRLSVRGLPHVSPLRLLRKCQLHDVGTVWLYGKRAGGRRGKSYHPRSVPSLQGSTDLKAYGISNGDRQR
ncbi:unnamed protein product, partial [Ectocarpus sp. 13 AM-2016]